MSSDWDNYDLNEKIITNLTENCKFDSPTDIQKRVLQYLNSKVDLIIQARTGEGKTLCYGIPIINYILNLYERAEDKIKTISPVALIIVPTRELGLQVSSHLSAIIKDISKSEEKQMTPKVKRTIYLISFSFIIGLVLQWICVWNVVTSLNVADKFVLYIITVIIIQSVIFKVLSNLQKRLM